MQINPWMLRQYYNDLNSLKEGGHVFLCIYHEFPPSPVVQNTPQQRGGYLEFPEVLEARQILQMLPRSDSNRCIHVLFILALDFLVPAPESDVFRLSPAAWQEV